MKRESTGEPARPCAYCGVDYVPLPNKPGQGDKSRKYCSNACWRGHLADSRRVHSSPAEAHRHHARTRRARKAAARIERFSADEVYERDRWICGICHKRVDRRLKWPNQMTASLDHIVPLADGGDHSRANTQCAHWLCNSRKGATSAGQLHLI